MQYHTLMYRILFLLFVGACGCTYLHAQPVPGVDENIPFLVTFGKDAPADWGDDDHCSVYFFSLPANHIKPFYIRVFDPDTGGLHDEKKGVFDSRTRISVYGGTGTLSAQASRSTDPIPGFDAGVLLTEKTFTSADKYDDKWYTFGPFNPKEGEMVKLLDYERIYFKVIVQGIGGDDGNLYRLFFSDFIDQNQAVEGAESFTYEYTFRMQPGMAHLYPFIDDKVLSIRQENYDFDDDGYLRLVSAARKSELATISTDGKWGRSMHKIYEEERNVCMDIQVVSLVQRRNNNVVFSIYNQYGSAVPILNIPIGIERIQNSIRVRKK